MAEEGRNDCFLFQGSSSRLMHRHSQFQVGRRRVRETLARSIRPVWVKSAFPQPHEGAQSRTQPHLRYTQKGTG
jgi:hypothetical protein